MQDNTIYMHIYTCSKLIVNMSELCWKQNFHLKSHLKRTQRINIMTWSKSIVDTPEPYWKQNPCVYSIEIKQVIQNERTINKLQVIF